MAKNPKTVNDFLDDLRASDWQTKEKKEPNLKKVKKADLEARGETDDGHFYLWDRAYYNRKILREKYSADKYKIAEYFPLTSTVTEC